MNDNLARMYQESQRRMREALEAVEWVEARWTTAGNRLCPWCENFQDEGTSPTARASRRSA